MIEITLGKFYTRNKTAKYLLPIVDSYSNEFKYQFKNVNKGLLASAIGDVKYDSAKGKATEYALFMLYDINGAFDVNVRQHTEPLLGRTMFNQFLKYCRSYTHYVDDYYFRPFTDTGFNQQHLCCIITKIPKKYHVAYDRFLQSAYSKMYNEEELATLHISPVRGDNKSNPIWKILTKDAGYKKEFERNVNEYYGTNVVIDDDREFDLPVRKSDEWFNM
jgi:hypothetical protein